MNNQTQPEAIQEIIEKNMAHIVKLGNFESVFLFSLDGLILAKYSRREILDEKRAIQVSLLMQRVQKLVQSLASLSRTKEIFVEDEFGKKLVFRFVTLYNDPAIMVAVVPPRKNYRGATNHIEQLLAQFESMGQNSELLIS